ncbi:MAG TPA: single-stranded-DNA-specific exonuclease RecJ [Methylococcaceae bacterium]|nr:single-stranded-DNA-specific exonuclease RecJ [Methylococcaceae bacterium]
MPQPTIRKKIIRRLVDPELLNRLAHLHPVLRRVYAARRVAGPEELDYGLAGLPSPWLLSGMERLVDHLAEAIDAGRRILIVADYDADGATSCAVALLGLRMLGAEEVEFLVPNRFEDGYGLTPEIVAQAAPRKPDVLITVDNGISSLEGVAAAKQRGWTVLVTDHHLPGALLPDADAIVNPSLPADTFPSKSLAGVGVMFYVLLGLRARLRENGWFQRKGIAEPNLAQLLDLVALGTVADVVPLDKVNRILVHQGLQRIRAGQCRPGIRALLEVAGKSLANLTTAELGFRVAPRLNAAGRLDDMALGIKCLLAEDMAEARELAALLDAFNRERRGIEDKMKAEALSHLRSGRLYASAEDELALCLFDESWHQGVIGILASRVKDRLHRPVIAFAPGNDDLLKGSARSIAGIHIRDALSVVAARHPGLIERYGGHAMAAGLSVRRERYWDFVAAFRDAVAEHAEGLDLSHVVHTDGALESVELCLSFAEDLRAAGPWGQNFPEPVFDGEFAVLQARVVGEKHLKLVLAVEGGRPLDAIAFHVDTPTAWLGQEKLRIAYRLDVNEFRDVRGLQLLIDYLEPCG